jgi:hypothetical protein
VVIPEMSNFLCFQAKMGQKQAKRGEKPQKLKDFV